jgi:hypothetical protein
VVRGPLTEEIGNGVDSRNYMCGLLWALETLAWSPQFLARVSVFLADIASFDPGGNWTNRPSNSLATIFLPWHPQITAPFEKCKSAIQSVINEQPVVGWKLILALLPNNNSFTSGCHRPVWREFIPRDWRDSVRKSEYWERITACIDLAISIAKSDPLKLCELIKRLSDLPESAHEVLLEHLCSDVILRLTEADHLPLWEALNDVVKHHRKFSDADWALPVEAINKIANAAVKLSPVSPHFKYRYLFGSRDFDLYDGKDSFEEQRTRLDEDRQAAIIEIIGDGNVEPVVNFAANVAAPAEVGKALGAIATDEIESLLLPLFLDSDDRTSAQVVSGFIWSRFYELKYQWVDAVLDRAWSQEHKIEFLTRLPFEDEVWQRVSSQLEVSGEEQYWKNVAVRPYGLDYDLTFAVEKFLQYGRGGAAVMCLAQTVNDNLRFSEALATRALLAVVKSEHGINELDNYRTVDLIKRLQQSETSDKAALSNIEWCFLTWLTRFGAGSPVTLEKRLASDPTFFAEAIRLVFHSQNTSENERKKPDEYEKQRATNVYKLLTEWKRCPGSDDDGSFDAEAFNSWLEEAIRLTVSGPRTTLLH